MSSYISKKLRELVAERANYACEYCLMPQSEFHHQFEPDHVRASQHGGRTKADNLAFACFRCNRLKGPNLTSVDPLTDNVVLLFNPRTQIWSEHFVLEGAIIRPLTPERATVSLLVLNNDERIFERHQLIALGLYS